MFRTLTALAMLPQSLNIFWTLLNYVVYDEGMNTAKNIFLMSM